MRNIKQIGRTHILLCFSLVLLAATCRKSDNDCHRYIQIVNNSTDSVIYSYKVYGSSIDSCLLSKTAILASGESYSQYGRTCWENKLNANHFDIYIVEIYGLDTSGFLHCDSLYLYNDILRHYRLDESNVDSLKSVDWIIRYP